MNILNLKDLLFAVLMIFPVLGTSFYIQSMSLAPFSMVGYASAILYLLACRSKFVGASLLIACFVSVLVYSMLISAILIMLEGYEFRPNTFLGVVLGGVYFIALKELTYRLSSQQLNWILWSVLIFILIFFYIQFLAYFLFDYDVDFMLPITGEPQRLDGYVQETSFGTFKRVAGLFAEPAVHSYEVNVILMALCLRRALPIILFIPAIISVWLSFSASGILLSLIPFLMYFIQARSWVKLLFCFIALLASLFFSSEFYSIFDQQIERLANISGDASGADRLRFIDYFLQNLDYLFLGFGVFTDVRDSVPPSNFFVSLIYAFGMPCALLLSLVMVGFIRKHASGLWFWLFILYGVLLNFGVSSPFFWLNFSLIFMGVVITNRDPVRRQRLSFIGAT